MPRFILNLYRRGRGFNARPTKAGFALLISLALMSFLVLTIISFSSLVRVDLTVNQQGSGVTIARQNALVALEMALGDLQLSAGADRRVTARADIRGGSGTVANPLWTGVWESTPPLAAPERDVVTPLARGDLLFAGGAHTLSASETDFLRWLVSGSGTETAALPNTALTGDWGSSLAANGVYVVGAGTLVAQGSPESATTPTLEGVVVAPKVRLRATDATVQGHLAWWVGDEGVKARVLANVQPEVTGATPVNSRVRQFQLPTGPDISRLSNLNFFEASRDREELSRVFQPAGLPLALAGGSELPLGDRQALNRRWHDVSTFSTGLLTDTRWGGFRGDLTFAFNLPTIFSRYFGTPASTDRFYFADVNAYGYTARFPNWGILRDFFDLPNQIQPTGTFRPQMPQAFDGSNGAVYATDGNRPYVKGSSRHHVEESYHINSPIFPILARLQLSLGLSFNEGVERDASGDVIGVVYSPMLLLKPLTSFYNPYNIELEPAQTTLGITGNEIRWAFLPTVTLHVDTATRPVSEQVVFTLREVVSSATEPRAWADIAFLNYPPATIPPGATRIHTVFEDQFLNDTLGRTGRVNMEPTLGNTFNRDRGFMVIPLDDVWQATTDGSETGRPGNSPPPRFGLTDNEKDRVRASSDDVNVFFRVNSNRPGAIWAWYQSRRTIPVTSARSHVQYFTGLSNPIGDPSNYIEERSFTLADAVERSTDYGEMDILLTWGFWLRSANEPFAQTRLLVDSNFRTAGSPLLWDGLNDNFYVFQNFTGDVLGDQRFGFLGDDPVGDLVDSAGNINGVWGGGNSVTSGGVAEVVLFDVPRLAPISVGHLMHANLGRYAADPSYIVGQGFVPGRIANLTRPINRNFAVSGADHWDLSYIMNQQLWDSYYFSGLPETLTAEVLEDLRSRQQQPANHRLRILRTDSGTAALTTQLATAHTFFNRASQAVVEGAFNVNSTSREAWRAVLSSTRNIPVPRYLGLNPVTFNDPDGTVFSRFAHPTTEAYRGDGSDTFWSGYRVLTDDEVNRLANAIVDELEAMGEPFPTLADFINRPLEAPTGPGGRGRAGILQRAIEAAGINSAAPGGTVDTGPQPSGITHHNQFAGERQSQAFPGYLTQADILQHLGPVLTARSDTFVIRTYGDYVNPSNGVVESRAWLEAVVQRRPNDVRDGADVLDRDAERLFSVVSFRWLTREEV